MAAERGPDVGRVAAGALGRYLARMSSASKHVRIYSFRKSRAPAESASQIRASLGVTDEQLDLARSTLRKLGLLTDGGKDQKARRVGQAAPAR
jgi:hypothetical protein